MSGPGPDGHDDDSRRRDDDSASPAADPNEDVRPNDPPASESSADDATDGADSGARETPDDESAPSVAANGLGTADGASERAPDPEPGSAASESRPVTIAEDGLLRWFLQTEDSRVIAVRDVLSSVGVVALIGLLLFGLSGIWPPLVAVESGSMLPNMERGDLVFVVEENRFVGDGATGNTGIVTTENAVDTGHSKFGNPGDVIVFRPNGDETRTPIIHRAHFWVEEGENWVETEANPDYVGGSCAQLRHCTPDHAGFVTKGDNNPGYDQAGEGADTAVVKPEWIVGKGTFRIPWLGHVRLTFDEYFASSSVVTAAGGTPAGGSSAPVAVGATATGLAAFGWRRYRR